VKDRRAVAQNELESGPTATSEGHGDPRSPDGTP
jgi:hypothetical protein